MSICLSLLLEVSVPSQGGELGLGGLGELRDDFVLLHVPIFLCLLAQYHFKQELAGVKV